MDKLIDLLQDIFYTMFTREDDEPIHEYERTVY